MTSTVSWIAAAGLLAAATLVTTVTTGCGTGESPPPGQGAGPLDVCGRRDGTGIPAPAGGPTPQGGEVVFAIERLDMGDRDANGQPDPTVWQGLGYDIDCRVTTESSVDVCTAWGKVWADAPLGRDNNFGKLMLPIVQDGLDPSWRIVTGSWTLLVRFVALGVEADQSNVVAELYEGRGLGHPPAWDGSDSWPVAAPRTVTGYTVDGIWVSGTPVTARLQVGFSIGADTQPFYIVLHHAVLTARLTPDGLGATEGRIAGILDTEELSVELHRLGTTLDRTLCHYTRGSSPLDEMGDILADGKQSWGVSCSAISAGFGFAMRPARMGPPVAEEVPLDPCHRAMP